MRVLAICIKNYIDEDSEELYEAGEITKDEMIYYRVGDEGYVIEEHYNKDYWKIKETNK